MPTPRRACAAFLLLVPFLTGCPNDKGTTRVTPAPAGGSGETPIRLDMKQVRKELNENRPGTLNRYVGRTVEVDVAGVSILGGDANAIRLAVKHVGEGEGELKTICLSFRGKFALSDQRNAGLKAIAAGTYRGKVRGVIAGFPASTVPDCDLIELSPAWVEEPLTPAP
jgi:hypothetical protein